MKIIGCLHTAIIVSDLERAEYFYSQVLGLTKVERSLKYAGVWYQIGDHQLHLIVDAQHQSTLSNSEKWGRNPHFALSVANLDRAKADLQNHGYSMQMSASGRKALFTQDPDGNILEITQILSE